MRRSKTINGLRDGEIVTVWKAHGEGLMGHLIWAPELHYINKKWYIYFAASNHKSERNSRNHHRMFVIENEHVNPMNSDWSEKGQIKTMFESFSLDATVFEHKESLYYVWAQQDPRIPGNSNLYISRMKNPWTLEEKQIILTVPEYDWEKIGFKVNEAPAVIIRNGKVFITYSGSATDENYSIGLLWADEDADLLNGFSWNKLSEPIFVSSDKNKQYGPGHNSFTVSEDGMKDLIVYHARPEKNKEGDPLENPNRHARIQSFSWDDHGFPIFGEPIAD